MALPFVLSGFETMDTRVMRENNPRMSAHDVQPARRNSCVAHLEIQVRVMLGRRQAGDGIC